MTAELLSVHGVAKRYGAVVALRSVDLHVAAGEIHALLGANGAGKSTLVKILTGVVRPDEGTIAVDGVPVTIPNPAAAQKLGLAPVYQDPALVPDLTVVDNLRLTGTSLDGVMHWLGEMDLRSVDLTELVRDIELPLLRMLDLARALSRNPRLLLLDEITAALPVDLADRVFAMADRWKALGNAVLFITHRLAEVKAHCDMATVLRDGRDVGRLVPREGGEAEIVGYMLGDAATAVLEAQAGRGGRRVTAAGTPALEVRDLASGRRLRGVSFQLHAGEVLGIAALEAQGQDALFDCIAGDREPDGGEILIAGIPLHADHPADAINRGVSLVPADRQDALLPQRSVRENAASALYSRFTSWGPIRAKAERALVDDAVARLQVDTRAQSQVRRLSGGNQQKVTIARWVAAGFDVLLCFDPTRGIDVGTKRQIYDLVRSFADAGKAVLLFTSELQEIPLACDRVVVLHDGQVSAEMDAADADEETLLKACHGLVTT